MFRAARTFAGAFYLDLWLFPAATKAEAGPLLFERISESLQVATSPDALARYVAPVYWCPTRKRLWFEMAVADRPRAIHRDRVPAELWGGIETREAAEIDGRDYYEPVGSDMEVTEEHLGQWKSSIGCALVAARERVPFSATLTLANDSAALKIAKEILASKDSSSMPILADALEEAGCDSAFLLDHCRRAGPHYPGCWVLGLILGK